MLRTFHVGDGGLLHRLETIAHVTRLRRQLLAALGITWLPVMVLGLVAEQLTERREPIIHVLSVHVRLLIATPAFLILDQVFPRACRGSLEQLVAESFIPAAAEATFDRLVLRATRMLTSLIPETVLALLALAVAIAALAGVAPIGGFIHGGPLTAAQVWYALVCWPVFQFLLWRSLWRWTVWAFILAGLSRIDLALVPCHADRRGGISFLSQPSVGYCALLLFAVSSVLAAEWGHKLTVTMPTSFEPFVVAFAIVGMLVAFGPLLFFVLPLERARMAGLVESGGIATALGRRFLREEEPEPVAHMVVAHRETVERMVPVLFDTRAVILLLVATLLPVLPVLLIHIPREDWRMLLGLLTGGRLW